MLRATMSVALVGGIFAGAGSASAATVRFAAETQERFALVIFEAGAGEANDLKITDGPSEAVGPIVFHDAGASVSAGPGCVAVDRNTASCEWPGGYFELLIRLGDRDDSVSEAACPSCDVGWPDANILGGTGNDILAGTRTHLALYGGDGADVLRGGLDGDHLHGGSGADRIDGGADELGEDVVSYAGHRVGVTVNLDDDPIEGAAGENDMVVNVESVIGGAGDDRLVGDGGYNELLGGPGRDVLLGHGRNDRLLGGLQADVIRGGPGRDELAGDAGDDWLHGGPGADSISGDAITADSPVNRGGDDTVFGGDGADSLSGLGGADRLFGGDGDDWILGHGGPDLLDGGRGRDSLFAAGWADISAPPARDRAVDRVRGGPNQDQAWVEWRDVVSGVEEIHRRGKPAPLAGRRPPSYSRNGAARA